MFYPTVMQTFKKPERLRSKKLIDRLFDQGRVFKIYPFKVIWLDIKTESPFPVQVLMSVSKRNLRRAVDRNKIKRRIREAYRKHKNLINDYLLSKDKQCIIGFLHSGKEMTKYKDLEQKIIVILERLIEEHEKTIE